MSLSERQKKHLRGLAHPLHPIVIVGGKSDSEEKLEAITKELDGALHAHELVKVSVRVGDREMRDGVFDDLVKRTSSEFVQRIGNIGVLYRARKDKPKIILPDA
jgi:RNA-binding protein